VLARLPVASAEVSAFLGGERLAVADGRVSIPHADSTARTLMLRVTVADGRRGGAVWDGPVEFETGPGRIELGSWLDNGLAFYSGGVGYEKQVNIEQPEQWSTLDLGKVRGTVEVEINGMEAGTRVWSPYRFDVSGKLRRGENTITVRVFNTLAPYLKGASPTRTIFAGQDQSGVFGPVVIC
jgi:hypothetical protein